MKNRKVLAWLIIVVPVKLLTGFDRCLISQEKKALQPTGVLSAVKHGLVCSNSFVERVPGPKSGSIPADRLGRKQNLFWMIGLYRFSSLASEFPQDGKFWLLVRPVPGLGVLSRW